MISLVKKTEFVLEKEFDIGKFIRKNFLLDDNKDYFVSLLEFLLKKKLEHFTRVEISSRYCPSVINPNFLKTITFNEIHEFVEGNQIVDDLVKNLEKFLEYSQHQNLQWWSNKHFENRNEFLFEQYLKINEMMLLNKKLKKINKNKNISI